MNYLIQAFHNWRYATLAQDGSDTITVSNAIATLTRAWLSRNGHSAGENVDKLFRLLLLLSGHHLFQVEQSSVRL